MLGFNHAGWLFDLKLSWELTHAVGGLSLETIPLRSRNISRNTQTTGIKYSHVTYTLRHSPMGFGAMATGQEGTRKL